MKKNKNENKIQKKIKKGKKVVLSVLCGYGNIVETKLTARTASSLHQSTGNTNWRRCDTSNSKLHILKYKRTTGFQ